MMGWLLKLVTGNPVSLLWIVGGAFTAGLLAGGGGAWTVQGWRLEANEGKWQAREAKIIAETAIKIEAAHQRVRDLEQDIAQLLANASAGYQAKLKEKDHALKVALNAVRDGTGRLFVTAACPPAGGDSSGNAATPAPGRDGGARAELSQADSRFLLELGAEADTVTLQLTACQSVVRADRARR